MTQKFFFMVSAYGIDGVEGGRITREYVAETAEGARERFQGEMDETVWGVEVEPAWCATCGSHTECGCPTPA